MFYQRTSPLVVLHDGGGDGGRDLPAQRQVTPRVIEMGAYVTGLAAMIELNDPPAVPPDGCVDPLMWQLAWQRFELHRRNSMGECVTCRARSCPGPDLAPLAAFVAVLTVLVAVILPAHEFQGR